MQNNYLKNKNPLLYKICAAFLACIIILNGNSIFTTKPNKSTRYFNILFILFVVFIGISLGLVKISRASLKTNIVWILVLFIYNLCLILKPENISDALYILKLDIILVLSFVYFKLCCDGRQLPQVLKYYTDIMTILGIISLFFWIFGSALHIISPDTSVLSNWSSFNGFANNVPSYHNLYFEIQQNNGIFRNSSIFAEAPMASLHFSLAFTIETLFRIKDKRHYFRICILFLSVLSTFSSTGYIVLVLIMMYKVLFSNIIGRLKPIIIIVLLVIGVTLVGYIFSLKLDTESGSIRLDDYKAAFSAWKDKPLLGWGFSSTEIRNYMSLWRGYNLGFSSTGVDIMAHNGIYGIIPYIIFLLHGIKRNLNKKNMLFFILIVLFLMLTTLFTNTFLLFNLMAFLFYVSPNNEK